jgi:hypothetical protein
MHDKSERRERDKKKRKEERRTGMDRVVHQNFDRTSCFMF